MMITHSDGASTVPILWDLVASTHVFTEVSQSHLQSNVNAKPAMMMKPALSCVEDMETVATAPANVKRDTRETTVGNLTVQVGLIVFVLDLRALDAIKR